MKTGVYAGSFNPFHKGHYNILEKASYVFDKIYVAQFVNSNKKEESIRSFSDQYFNSRYSFENIALPDRINNCIVIKEIISNELLTDFCNNIDASYIIRGIRSNKDFDYEKELYNYNKLINSDIETIYFMPDKKVENLSSSFIRELIKYDKSVREYLI